MGHGCWNVVINNYKRVVTKKKICNICGECKPIFSKGRCMSCTPKKPLTRSPINKKPYYIPKQTEKNKTYRKSQSAIRDEFFDYLIPRCTHSEEDGSPIYSPSRVNVAHLWYKRTYKSVQGNVGNYVYLTQDQHTRFDQLLDSNDFKQLEKEFKCWGLIVERMKNLLPEVIENGKLKLLFEEYLINFEKS